MTPTLFDAIIVGAGPAGVSCAVWLQQLGFRAALVDKHDRCGGLQLSNPYTNTWIATSADVHGADVARALHANAVRHGVSLHLSRTATGATQEDGAWVVGLSDGTVLRGRRLVLAGGVVPKTGGILARASLMVGPGPQVAQTDFAGARVAILGGGDSAFENHAFVSDRGAACVHIYARSLKARLEMLEKVPAEDVFVGAFEFDAQHNRVNGQAYDSVLVLFGYEANRASLLGLEPAMQANGFVQTDASCRTSLPGVYAIGELAQRAHPCCVTAMADGVVAAKAIQRELEADASTRYLKTARRGLGLLKKLGGAA